MSIPYIGYATDNIKSELRKITNSLFPHLDINFIASNKRSLASLFRHKERLNKSLCSNVIYIYKCTCNSTYVGSTTRQLHCRICEHEGISPRSKLPLTSPPFSAIGEHYKTCGEQFNPDLFEILDSSTFNLRLLESLYIFKLKPKLNTGSPVDLSVVP